MQSAYCVSLIRPIHDPGRGCPDLDTIEEDYLSPSDDFWNRTY